jgi:putative ABC transport system permease protein
VEASVFLKPTGLIWASAALLTTAGISLALDLRLAKSLVWSGVRALLQLYLLGLVLTWIFQIENIIVTSVAILLMTVIATHTVLGRASQLGYRGIAIHSFFALAIATWFCAAFAGTAVLNDGAWRKSEVILPFTGLLLGNSLSGISLGLLQWAQAFRDQRDWIETRLAYGATSWEAVHPLFRKAMLTAMTPILNSMTVAGIVSLPGMMTGQILAGANPTSAVLYQIAALFLIAVSTFFGILLALGMGYRSLFNSRHQVSFSRLSGAKE